MVTRIGSATACQLQALHHVTFEAATFTLTAYMLCAAAGMFVGGFVAARWPRHSDKVVAGCMTAGAICMALCGSGWLSAEFTMVILAATGLAIGVGGPSRDMIPAALAGMRDCGMRLGFALVDGDHSAAGVRDDVELILRLAPADSLQILVHDSYNPDCRRGLRAVRWEEFPEVRLVDLDFVPGGFHARARGGAFARSMWGGFARIETLPGKREGSILFGNSQQEQHDIVFRHSAHRLWHKVLRRCRSLLWR